MEDSERRSYPRLAGVIPVACQPAREAAPDSLTATSRNISARGMCLVLDRPCRPGETLRLTFLLPGAAQPVNATGSVKWVQEFIIGGEKAYDLGVELVNMSESDQEQIDSYLARRTA